MDDPQQQRQHREQYQRDAGVSDDDPLLVSCGDLAMPVYTCVSMQEVCPQRQQDITTNALVLQHPECLDAYRAKLEPVRLGLTRKREEAGVNQESTTQTLGQNKRESVLSDVVEHATESRSRRCGRRVSVQSAGLPVVHGLRHTPYPTATVTADGYAPRPPNAFLLYRRHHYPLLAAQYPNLTTQQLSTLIGQLWHQEHAHVKHAFRTLGQRVRQWNQTVYAGVPRRHRKDRRPSS